MKIAILFVSLIILKCSFSFLNSRISQKLHIRLSSSLIDIDHRTTSCLDFDVILSQMKESTVTIEGADICIQSYRNTSFECEQLYSMVDQLGSVLGLIPLRTSMNIFPVIKALELNLSPPEKEDLWKFAEHIDHIVELRDFMEHNLNVIPLFTDLVTQMQLPEEFLIAMIGAFDDDGQLSAEKYPIIGNLRRATELLRGKIIQTLRVLLQSQEMKEKIADR